MGVYGPDRPAGVVDGSHEHFAQESDALPADANDVDVIRIP